MNCKLLTTNQAAKKLNRKPQTLNWWRCKKKNLSLPYYKIGGAVRYKDKEVDAFIESNKCPPNKK